MTARNEHIVVSPDEKSSLDDVADEKFGTKQVPYGAVIASLTDDYLGDRE